MSATETCTWCAEEIPAEATRCPRCQGNLTSIGAPAAAAVTPKAPAGWYPDPKMVDTRRYWDGATWTEHRAPADTARPPVTARQPTQSWAAGILATNAAKDDTSYAWTLAVIPAIVAAMAWIFPKIANGLIVSAIVLVVTVSLCVLDNRRLRNRGFHDVPSSAWALLVPGYLISRTIKIGSPAMIPILWFLTFAVSLASAFTAPTPTTYKGDDIAQLIQLRLESKFAIRATVTCPDAKRVLEGDSIDCDVTYARDGSAGTAHVEFDNHGGFTWKIQ